MIEVTAKVEGLRELDKILTDEMPNKIARQLVKKSLRAGAKPIQVEAKRLVPKKTRRLMRAIKVRAGWTRGSTTSVRVSVGKKDFQGDQFYGSFQEFGWKIGKRRSGALRLKKIPGKHFMERAYDSKKVFALKLFTDTLRAGIEAFRSRFKPKS